MNQMNSNRPATLSIDGALVESFCAKSRVSIDYTALIRHLERTDACSITDCRYYASASAKEGILRFQALLGHQGIQVIQFREGRKTEECPHCRKQYEKGVQKECDITMSLDLWEFAGKRFSPLYLLSGDGDFAPLVRRIRERFDKEVVVISNRESLSPNLCGVASRVVLLDEIMYEIRHIRITSEAERGTPGKSTSRASMPQRAQGWKDVLIEKVIEFCSRRSVADPMYGPRAPWGFILHETCRKLISLGYSPESCPLLVVGHTGYTKCQSRACKDLIAAEFGKAEIMILEDGHPWLLVGGFGPKNTGLRAA